MYHLSCAARIRAIDSVEGRLGVVQNACLSPRFGRLFVSDLGLEPPASTNDYHREKKMYRAARFVVLLALFVISPAVAPADNASSDKAAQQVAEIFLKAMGAKSVEDALKVSDTPFVTDQQKILTSKDAIRGYIKAMLDGASPDDMANAILGVVPYEKSRELTDAKVLKIRDQVLKTGDWLVGIGRNNLARGYLFVRIRGSSAAVVGIGF